MNKFSKTMMIGSTITKISEFVTRVPKILTEHVNSSKDSEIINIINKDETSLFSKSYCSNAPNNPDRRIDFKPIGSKDLILFIVDTEILCFSVETLNKLTFGNKFPNANPEWYYEIIEPSDTDVILKVDHTYIFEKPYVRLDLISFNGSYIAIPVIQIMKLISGIKNIKSYPTVFHLDFSKTKKMMCKKGGNINRFEIKESIQNTEILSFCQLTLCLNCPYTKSILNENKRVSDEKDENDDIDDLIDKLNKAEIFDVDNQEEFFTKIINELMIHIRKIRGISTKTNKNIPEAIKFNLNHTITEIEKLLEKSVVKNKADFSSALLVIKRTLNQSSIMI